MAENYLATANIENKEWELFAIKASKERLLTKLLFYQGLQRYEIEIFIG